MKNVITYSRSATDEKIINHRTGKLIDPLEYQNESINEYCSYFNYKVVEHFQEFYGGHNFNGTQWNILKKLIIERQGKSNAIDSIIIIRPDRLSRNLILSFKELKELSNLGCEVECVEGFIYDNQIRRLNILNRLNENNKNNNMKNVIIYSRVSTDEQANQGYSIEYQEETITRYCIHKGYNILKTFREDYSAKDFNRPEWKKIISLIQESRRKSSSIDTIVFLRPDRFSRNMVFSFLEIAKLSKIGCEVEFLEGDIDVSNPESLLLQAIGFALPEVENRKISKRSKEGSHKARQNGCFTGTPPKGYRCVRIGKDSSLEFSQDADLIRQSFEKMASGLYTADEVRRWLNGQGMKLSKNQFPNIIRNLTYSGKILVRAFGNEPEQIVQGLHPALISEELFAKANDVLSGRKRKMDFKSDKINIYPLKGHLCCPTHGRTLSAYASTGRSGNKFHYYICTKPHVKCERYPIGDVHNQVERILSNIQLSAQMMATYRTTLEGLFENDDLNRKKNIQKALDEVERLNKRKSFIEEQYMDGELPAQEYQDLKNNINTRLFNEKTKLQKLQEVLSPFREYLDKQVPMLEDLVGFYKSVDGRTKNKILGCIFSEKLYLEEKKVATPKFTTPIELLLNASKALQNSKNKKEVNNDLFLLLAPSLGLEPRTL